MSIPLTLETYSKFSVAKSFENNDPNTCVTSLDFDDSGQYLISSLTSESIHLYDAFKGTYNKPIYSKKYGCHLARFTHQQKNCVYASTKEDNLIRYLSLSDNSYIRYFRGHKGLVNALEVSPTQNVFVSASLDDTVKIWDLRTSTAQVSVPSAKPSFLAFDPAGLVVAIASQQTNKVLLKDARQFELEQFLELDLPEGFKFNKVEFSNDNKYILVSSVNRNHLILDAYEGNIICELGNVIPIPPRRWPDTGSATFSPDGKFVFSGNGDGTVAVWNLKSDNELPPVLLPAFTLKGDAKPRMLAFNQKYLQLITADSQLTMWLPDLD